MTMIPMPSGWSPLALSNPVFYRDDNIFIVYVDDSIFLGQSEDQLTGIIKKLMDIGLEVEDQGHIADYVGVNIKCLPVVLIHLTRRLSLT
ncbi:hypothetical protein ACHAW6_012590 [Cyclotella cf. meneghiniana]